MFIKEDIGKISRFHGVKMDKGYRLEIEHIICISETYANDNLNLGSLHGVESSKDHHTQNNLHHKKVLLCGVKLSRSNL